MKVAIIGAGIAGLVAGSTLRSRHQVHVFERQPRAGGNAWTVRTPDGAFVDIAVAAFGRAGYPHFRRLLRELNVPLAPPVRSLMSFHDLGTGRGLYLTPSTEGLLAQRLDLLHPRHLRAVTNLALGLNHAIRQHEAGTLEHVTVGQLLARIPELRGEARAILLCALALLSSMSVAELMGAPAAFFLQKLEQHPDVISPLVRRAWRGVEGGTRTYVEALTARLGAALVLDRPVAQVRRDDVGVTLRFEDGQTQRFDRVVFACPADTALALLEAPTEDERRLLGAWRYNDGRVVLHRDASAFPPRALMQAYTFLYRRGADGQVAETSVNGALWFEPQAPADAPWISSQYPNFPLDPAKVALDVKLRTPIFDFASTATRAHLPRLNGHRHTYFCGSYFGFGLHEDAVSSALKAAHALDEGAHA